MGVVIQAVLTHCEAEIEGLRNRRPHIDNETAAKRIVELMAVSLALDNAAFSGFIELVISTRISIRELESS